VKASLTSTSTFWGSVDISIKKEEGERVDQGLFCFVLIGKKKKNEKKTSTVFLLKLSFSINLRGVICMPYAKRDWSAVQYVV